MSSGLSSGGRMDLKSIATDDDFVSNSHLFLSW